MTASFSMQPEEPPLLTSDGKPGLRALSWLSEAYIPGADFWMKKTVNTHRPWRMWVAAGPTSTFLQKLKTGQGQKPPLWVSSKLSLASRKPSGQITIVIHPFVIQGQKVILTHEKMSPLSIPCKSPATSQEPRGGPAKAILPARHERKVPTFSSSPAQHCRNSKGITIVKKPG